MKTKITQATAWALYTAARDACWLISTPSLKKMRPSERAMTEANVYASLCSAIKKAEKEVGRP